MQAPMPASARYGSGLVIEPASVWGNGAEQIKLTDFSMISAPGSTWLPDVAADAKQQALTIPRAQRDDPPAHALIAANGDLLRGEIEAATKENFGFRSGMEELVVPRDRVKAVIWLGKPVDAQAAATPVPESPTEKLLKQKLEFQMSFGGADLSTMLDWLERKFPD